LEGAGVYERIRQRTTTPEYFAQYYGTIALHASTKGFERWRKLFPGHNTFNAIVLELLPNDLMDKFDHKSSDKDEQHKRDALRALHKMDIAHRNIKPEAFRGGCLIDFSKSFMAPHPWFDLRTESFENEQILDESALENMLAGECNLVCGRWYW